MTRTEAAFRLSAERLFDLGPVYFWTLTFAGVHDDWAAARLFSRFLNHLRLVVGRTGWGGLRVCELHREHGVHYHLLVTERLAVDLVRRVGRCYGIGRVQVERADADAARYLSKYLSKRRPGPVTESGRRARRWAAFGDIPRTRVSDLVNDSEMWTLRRREKLQWLGFAREQLVLGAWITGGAAAMRSAYFAVKAGRLGDAAALALGRLESRGHGETVWRARLDYAPF